MQLSQVGEFRLIEAIAKQTARPHPAVVKGIGDDAAVIKTDARTCLLITTDTLTEGVHFRQAHAKPYRLGKKCLSVNLSDIAAMGGTPLYYTVSLSVAPRTPLSVIKQFYRGMDAQARRYKAVLLGGDTVASRAGLSISITLLGSAPAKQIVYRCGACRGDLIFVSGTLGDSALGLKLLSGTTGLSAGNRLVQRHLDPVPRVAEGRALARAGIATSMIDISDGLLADLGHILKQSRAGARVFLDDLPLSAAYRRHAGSRADDYYRPALSGGEDYELLFTAPPEKRSALERLSKKLKTPFTCIGKITGRSGRLELVDAEGQNVPVSHAGYKHF